VRSTLKEGLGRKKNRRLRHEIDLFGFLVVETAETQLKKEEEEEE
jgi:hypothetical protein